VTRIVAIVVAWVVAAGCAEGREEIIETNVPLYLEAGAPSGSADGGGAVAAPNEGGVDAMR